MQNFSEITLYVYLSLFFVLGSLFLALCSWLYALRSTLNAQCSMLIHIADNRLFAIGSDRDYFNRYFEFFFQKT